VSTFGIKDFPTINTVYVTFSSYILYFHVFGVNSETFEDNTDDQISKLKSACENLIDTVEEAIADLDKNYFWRCLLGGQSRVLKSCLKG
jgi:hypothetical protein